MALIAITPFVQAAPAGFDITNPTLVSSFLSPQATQTIDGLNFKPDGTKMYIYDDGTRKIFQYTLTTPWEVNSVSAVYDSVFFLANVQAILPTDICFKPDGTKLYIIGRLVPNAIFQYTLTTPWDVGTAVYDIVSFPIAPPSSFSRDLFFKPDGTLFYVVDNSLGKVLEFSLTTPWDMSTASDANKFLNTAPQSANIQSAKFNLDGTKIFVTHRTGLTFQYSMTTPYDVSTAIYDSIFFDSSATAGSQLIQLQFNSDGTNMYLSAGRVVFQYSL